MPTDPRLGLGASPTVNQLLFDSSLRRAVFFQRWKAHLVATVIADLNTGAFTEAAAIIDWYTEMFGSAGASVFDLAAHVPTMLAQTQLALATGFAQAETLLVGELNKAATSEAAWQLRLFAQTVPIEWQFAAPSPAAVSRLITADPFNGKVLSQWWQGIAKDTQAVITERFQQGMALGTPPPEIAQSIIGTPAQDFADGALEASRHQAETIIRTAAAKVAADTRMETFAENDDIVASWRFVATLDHRTSFICMAHDGIVSKVGEGDEPPLHFNCRSTVSPVLKSLEELGITNLKFKPGKRASMFGEVPKETTYEEWLKQQTPAFQDAALGPGRAQRFRDGKVKLRELLDANDKPLTLAQIDQQIALHN